MNEFLASYNVTADEISPTGDWLAFSVHISKANEMFGASYTVFEHEETGRQSLNTLEYSIPETLKGHLELVHPTVSYVFSSLFMAALCLLGTAASRLRMLSHLSSPLPSRHRLSLPT